MEIGIIGSGKMGAGLGRLWAKHGHYVMFSYSRRPEKLQDLVREIGSHARSGSTEDAVRYGNVVLLAVPWAAIGDALSDAGPLNRKILISCVNPFGARGLKVGLTTSAAEEISKLTPDAAVVEAFNTVFASILHSGAHLLVRQRGKGAQLHSPCHVSHAQYPITHEDRNQWFAPEDKTVQIECRSLRNRPARKYRRRQDYIATWKRR